MRNQLLILLVVVCSVGLGAAQEIVFEPSVKSLRQYECPEWFRDAKFGIWSHWTGYCASKGMGDWYARNMYIEGHPHYKHHVKTFGHPSTFGYKDVIETWKIDKFDANAQMKLFKQAGAKYFVALANHHDNFDLWDSQHQKWNSVNNGPGVDIVGTWRKAALKEGLRWGVTSHLERTWSWFQTNKGSDKKGPLAGVPYDGVHPEYQHIYLPPEPTGDRNQAQPKNASKWWRDHWFARCKDLIDNYKPDLFYVDGGVPFPGDDKGATGLKMMAYLYNSNASWHGGQNEAVMCLKNWLHVAPDGAWGYYWEGIGTQDCERTRLADISPEPWQTDTSIGGWCWTPSRRYRSTEAIVHELVDIVSKNGNLLINIPQRPDGSLDDECLTFLREMGQWLESNGPAIYASRPWTIAGEGLTEGGGHGPSAGYKATDIRYTQSKDGHTIYATALGLPDTTLTLQLTRVIEVSPHANVTMLANSQTIPFRLGERKELILDLSNINAQNVGCDFAYSFAIEGLKMTGVKLQPIELADIYMHDVKDYEPLPGTYKSQYPYLSAVKPVIEKAHNGVKRDKNYRGNGPIQIGGKSYEHGLMLCPSSDGNRGFFIVNMDNMPKVKGFSAEIGIDDAMSNAGNCAFIIDVFVSGEWKTLYKSRVLTYKDEAVKIDVDIPEDADFIRIVTTDGGNGCSADHAVWADAKFRE